MPDMGTGSVEANGMTFHYFTMGDGPLVLCMHGFPDHAYTYSDLLPELAAAGFRGVAPFMRGYLEKVILPGTGHFLYLERPQEVNQRIIAFFNAP